MIVCGHYGCGGVRTAIDRTDAGLLDNCLKPIRSIYEANRADLDAIHDYSARVDALCELNVRFQVMNVSRTSILQHAWTNGRPVTVHGFLYSLADGILHDLGFTVTGPDDIEPSHRLIAHDPMHWAEKPET